MKLVKKIDLCLAKLWTLLLVQTYRLRAYLLPKDWLMRVTDQRYEGPWLNERPDLFKIEHIQSGCILLCAGVRESRKNQKQGLTRKLIAYASSGPYTHCGIVFKKNNRMMVYESSPGKGVAATPLLEFVARYKYLAACREPALKQKHWEKLCTYADNCVRAEMGYSYLNAVLAPVREFWHQSRHHLWIISGCRFLRKRAGQFDPNLKIETHKRNTFCSEFVLDCFLASGIHGFDNPLYASKAWTPMMLAESNTFPLIGYVAKSYQQISHSDPFLAGNGWRLSDWEEARSKRHL
jgi:hypothetical protein